MANLELDQQNQTYLISALTLTAILFFSSGCNVGSDAVENASPQATHASLNVLAPETDFKNQNLLEKTQKEFSAQVHIPKNFTARLPSSAQD